MAVIDDLIQRRATEAVRIVARHAHVRAAYLFGSHIEGTADRFSDIDIAAFVEGAEQWDIRRRARAAVEAQKQVGSDIELHLFPAELLENPPAASFAAYIKTHGVPVEI